MKKKISGIAFLIITLISFLLVNMKNELFTKDYYIGIVMVQGDSRPEITFFNKSLAKIGNLHLDAKDFFKDFQL
ncbi:hypothetical protein HMPREF0631_1524 [Peptostreptococcus anaerobius 653-L]|uniref:Uncharacterized protein n=1 Tax=Peptostreptococcus anaerobius 653-L TaxID=596329 RepID=D3MQB1_9FIRM|nr:hypothetical protein [Peptostreptococcus anaerobius]EFD05730.1 hypothetical protein HMPREF0631_1524 [Peptostreptococcus anaerobius 653-L]